MPENELPEILHLAAFADGAGGGNMAGVVLDAAGLTEAHMQDMARTLGYSETAFVTRGPDENRRACIRYFSPGAEVPFCGHATVATAVALAEKFGTGPFFLDTAAGEIVLATKDSNHGMSASFTSVQPSVSEIDPDVLGQLMDLLSLNREQLDPDYPPRLSFAGNTHPVVVLRTKEDLDGFDFDAAALRRFMDRQGWPATVTIAWVKTTSDAEALELEARNLFPVGDIREDPATGSAAAAVGAYLRDLGSYPLPATVLIRQGRHVGRPSILEVHVPETGGITVAGTAEHVR